MKKKSNNKRIIFELSILIPAFNYIYPQYKIGFSDILKKEDKRHEDVLLYATKRLAYMIKTHKDTRNASIAQSNRILSEIKHSEKINTFYFGLLLLKRHHELENKQICFRGLGDISSIIENVENCVDNGGIGSTPALSYYLF